MGDNVMGIWEKVKDILLIDKVVARLMQYVAMIPDWVYDFYNKHTVECLIVDIALLVLLAFTAYKLFKMGMYVLGAGAFGICGYYYLAPIVAQFVAGKVPEFIRVEAVVAIVCALIGVFLTRCAYTFMVMILGGALGYLFGYVYMWRVIRDFFHTLNFLKDPVARYIIGGVCAAVAVLLFILLFKHVFIVGSSFGCMAVAGLLLQKLVMPVADDKMKWAFVIFGLLIGGFAVMRQYKDEEKSLEIVF